MFMPQDLYSKRRYVFTGVRLSGNGEGGFPEFRENCKELLQRVVKVLSDLQKKQIRFIDCQSNGK